MLSQRSKHTFLSHRVWIYQELIFIHWHTIRILSWFNHASHMWTCSRAKHSYYFSMYFPKNLEDTKMFLIVSPRVFQVSLHLPFLQWHYFRRLKCLNFDCPIYTENFLFATQQFVWRLKLFKWVISAVLAFISTLDMLSTESGQCFIPLPVPKPFLGTFLLF